MPISFVSYDYSLYPKYSFVSGYHWIINILFTVVSIPVDMFILFLYVYVLFCIIILCILFSPLILFICGISKLFSWCGSRKKESVTPLHVDRPYILMENENNAYGII